MTQQHQKQFASFLGGKLIAYNAKLVRVFGNINAAIFLSQLLYWWDTGKYPDWIFKTVAEFEEETGLTESKQLSGQRTLVSFGIIEVEHRGVPPKRFFKINIEKLYEVCSEYMLRNQIPQNQGIESDTSETVSKQ